MKKELYLGLDVHKDYIMTAIAEAGRKGEVRESGAISNDLQAVEKWIGRLRKAHGKEGILRACYEAGPQTSSGRDGGNRTRPIPSAQRVHL